MIKKVKVEQLAPGVFIKGFDCGWMGHPFLFNSKLITSEKALEKLRYFGIREVFIDTEKGRDIEDAPSEAEHKRQIDQEIRTMVNDDVSEAINHIPLQEEITQATSIKREATKVVRTIMARIRQGKNLEPDQAHVLVRKIDESISRNKDALVLLLRLRNKDNYTFNHSVGVGALMMSFSKHLGLSKQRTHEIGLGSLLHDIGKMKIPVQILNKPGKLSDLEFAEIKKHVQFCGDILSGTKKIPKRAALVALQHHERIDGNGYPQGLKGDDICLGGQMAAIVDVFDAITSRRCYRNGLDPVDGLRRLYEWSKYHFDEMLAHRFIKHIGIYPVGTVVELESGMIGVVIDSTEHLLKPVVSVVYNKKKNWPVSPRTINLDKPFGKGGADKIISYESARRFNIDPFKMLGLER
ncbi:MAG: HD-GYP domain-containing protein [Proteobacteria bacterium]|nr:HD-GYP domain-containing protein [Pseudomonadota bacterium]MBU1709516.1 HD-GYP domain-containing protein [Pseudomonadota bacterium]